MRHKSCPQFLFFQIIRQNAVNGGFRYPVLSTIILQLARWLSFKTAATRAMFSFDVFVHFWYPVLSAVTLHLARWLSFKTAATLAMFSLIFVVPGLLFRSASSRNSSSAANGLCHRNTVACDTDESPNAFTTISHIFAAVNPSLQQNFIVAHCSKFFSMVIYKKSTEHTILQNALILLLIDRLISNLVSNFYNDCATSHSFWDTVSKLMGRSVYFWYINWGDVEIMFWYCWTCLQKLILKLSSKLMYF